jgi:hypothetical protein
MNFRLDSREAHGAVPDAAPDAPPPAAAPPVRSAPPGVPLPPTRPELGEPRRSSRGAWFAIILALAAFVGAYLALVFLSLGFLAPLIVIGGLVFLVTAFHYVVWGWWLGRVIRQARENEGNDDDTA